MRKIKLYFATLFLVTGLYHAQLTSTENYIYTIDHLSKSGEPVKTIETVSYFDGLGRPKQNIAVKAGGNQKDLVTPFVYDGLGRQAIEVLPIPKDNSQLAIHPVDKNSGSNFYGNYPYAEKKLEYSSLGRPQEQYNPGEAWRVNDKKNRFSYGTNASTEVRQYTATFDYSTFSSSITLSTSYYPVSTLHKNTVTDEDGNSTSEYINGEGQTILIRKILNTVSNSLVAPQTAETKVDTYYVYNDYNQLAYVITPLAVAANNVSSTTLDELCYQYKYDANNRLVEKKLPGKGWEYMVYDKADRLVMTQDENMRPDKRWLFTKYDKLNRVIYTGTTTDPGTRAGIQTYLEYYFPGNVEGSGSFTQNGLAVGYTNSGAFPTYIEKLLSVNYYDTYPTGTVFPTGNKIQGVDIITSTPNAITSNVTTKSLPTASFVKNLEDDKWTKAYTFYDRKARPMGTYSYNHLGGYTKTELSLDFAGIPQKSITYHKRLGINPEVIIEENFTYDNQNRLTAHTHKVNADAPVTLAKNKYNEIGQLIEKEVGGDQNGNNPLQTISYTYNIRGWMTGVNSADIASQIPYGLNNGKLFAYKLRYNNPLNPSLGTASYSGNISEMDWISQGGSLKRYGYQYDNLNRLLKGNYQDPGSTLPESHINDETLTYDLNGNIKTLVRNAKHAKNNTPVVIDNLDYNQYDGNKVLRINDLSNNGSGYEGGNGLIGYDTNGNMTAMPDKGISAIAYNFLNLPRQITQNANVTNYYYRADGVKVKKTFVLTNAAGTKTINTEYLDGFQYSTPNTDPLRKALEKEDDATMAAATAGEEEAFSPDPDRMVVAKSDPGTSDLDNMTLSFFPTAEGYYDYENLRYIYQYKDHLGNVRLSYVKNSAGVLQVMDSNDYYPFGMSHLKNTQSVYDPMSIPYNYKYNGKELQETGMYDYGARFYMPDIGRWGVIDPLAEKMTRHSTYNYAFDNPIRFIDPDGREGNDVIIKGGASALALNEIKKAVGSELNVNMDNNGKLSYTQVNPGTTLSNNAQQLTTAIDDHSVVVNVTAEYSNYTSEGEFYRGGGFMGNSMGFDDAFNQITNAYQEINPSILGRMSDYFKKPGQDVLHEVTEAYKGAKFSQTFNLPYVGSATAEDNDNPFSIYNLSHHSAVPQTATNFGHNYFDKNGNPSRDLYKSGRGEFFVKDPSNKVEPQRIIQTYP